MARAIVFLQYLWAQKYDENHTLMDIGTVIKERRALLGIPQQDLSGYLWSRHLNKSMIWSEGWQPVATDTTEDTGCGVGMEMVLQVKQTVK